MIYLQFFLFLRYIQLGIYIQSSLKKILCVCQAVSWCGAFLHQKPSPLYDEPLQWLQLPVDSDNQPSLSVSLQA